VNELRRTIDGGCKERTSGGRTVMKRRTSDSASTSGGGRMSVERTERWQNERWRENER